MRTQPGAPHGPHAIKAAVYRSGNPPEISIMMGIPAPGVVHFPGALLTCHGEILQHIE